MAGLNAPHRSSAVPLALVFAVLIVYASLYPFTGWTWPPGAQWTELVRLPMPRYRIAFDIWTNWVGYMPMGFLLYVAGVRSGGRPWPAWWLAVLLPSVLSYAMEVTQNFVPTRVPSLLDWLLNTGGGLSGAAVAALAQALSLIDRWQTARDRWFVRRSAGALSLLLLWPVGMLFPAPFPLGLGLGWERVQSWWVGWLLDVPWAQAWLETISDLPVPVEPPAAEVLGLGVTLGLLGPCLLAYSISRPGWRRLVLALVLALSGLAATTLSTALNFGPAHALSWWTPEVLPGLALALVLAGALAAAGPRLAAALGLVALSALVMLVAQAPADPYFADSLQAWQQGEFVRFHGLSEWVGWLWPFAAITWLVGRLGRRD